MDDDWASVFVASGVVSSGTAWSSTSQMELCLHIRFVLLFGFPKHSQPPHPQQQVAMTAATMFGPRTTLTADDPPP